MNNPVLEVCAADLDSVANAAKAGAARVELCSALAEGGVTPSRGLLSEALKLIKVNVLIRPRGGDFLYSDAEKECMLSDIRDARRTGANGVVVGALTIDGNIDIDFCRRAVEAAGPLELTFHRAFDLCRDPFEALEQIIALGFDRILTSGQAAGALQGVDVLRELNEKAGSRITILAGGGVNPGNAGEIIRLTGVRELHASARQCVPSAMKYRHDGVAMGARDSDEYSRAVSSPEIITGIINSMKTALCEQSYR